MPSTKPTKYFIKKMSLINIIYCFSPKNCNKSSQNRSFFRQINTRKPPRHSYYCWMRSNDLFKRFLTENIDDNNQKVANLAAVLKAYF